MTTDFKEAQRVSSQFNSIVKSHVASGEDDEDEDPGKRFENEPLGTRTRVEHGVRCYVK